MDKGLFSYFKGKRDNKRTRFDMSLQNIDSQRLFELKTKKIFEVLPDDTWEIGENVQTKVLPMKSPAFTRLKQNTYAVFNANQSVWSHWNDFITNGTNFSDTYGNNVTNQSLSNPWRVPQIAVNDLQLITKLATGWAIPVWKLDDDALSKLKKKVEVLADTGKFDSDLYGRIIKGNFDFTPNSDNYYYSEQTIFNLIVAALKLAGYPELSEKMETIPYVVPAFSVKDGSKGTRELKRLEIGCDPFTAFQFYCWIYGVNREVKVHDLNNQVMPMSSLFSVRCFCNPYSEDCNVMHAPFTLHKYAINDEVSSYYYTKNLYEDVTLSNLNLPWQFDSVVRSFGDFWARSEQNELVGLTSHTPHSANGVVYNSTVSINSYEPVLGLLGNYEDYLCDFHLDSDMANPFKVSVNFQTFTKTDYKTQIRNPFAVPVTVNDKGLLHAPVVDKIIGYYHPAFSDKPILLPCDVFLPVQYAASFSTIGGLPDLYYVSRYTGSLGFDDFGFLIYLSMSAARHLDAVGIPCEGFTVRSFFNYAFEFVNALPFFNYSKVWNDIFRNKTVSSAELDYRKTNGCMFLSKDRLTYLKKVRDFLLLSHDFESPYVPAWLEERLESDNENSWAIEMTYLPKNGLSRNTLKSSNLDYEFVTGFANEMHYFNLQTPLHVFSVLTGYSLQEFICSSALHQIVVNVKDNGIDEGVIYGILLDKFYFPNYYNGLLHLKYQNFPKDYFSSAFLDPQSGANVVDIPDNVVELRNAQAEQKFWEGIAVARSVRSFFQQKFGTTPSHGDEIDSLLLGQAHSPINIGEVIQTSQTDITPQGQRSGLGAAHDSSGLCKKTFNEHGFIIIIMSHTLELQYMQGLDNMFVPKESFLDYPFPDFAHVGNESIKQLELNYEVHSVKNEVLASMLRGVTSSVSKMKYNGVSSPALCNLTSNSAANVVRNKAAGAGSEIHSIFGYSPRWSNYKFSFDCVHGDMRKTLMFWHTFRKFFTQPILCHEFVNGEFIAENDEFKRIFAVDEEISDYFIINQFINANVKRAMPYVCAPAGS